MQDRYGGVIASLKEELKKPLPGEKVLKEMAPISRMKGLNKEPRNPKKGGVLILLYEKADELMLVFIERTDDGGPHSRQISFPGGKFEPSDKSLIDTSLREAEEEVGVNISQVQVLGNLTTMFIPVSNFLVSPTVGFYKGEPGFKLNTEEVAGLLEVPLKHLMLDKTKGVSTVDVRGAKFEVPVFQVNNHKIWGATAMMLNEFIQVVKRVNGKLE